jgi:hypothetical protein
VLAAVLEAWVWDAEAPEPASLPVGTVGERVSAAPAVPEAREWETAEEGESMERAAEE